MDFYGMEKALNASKKIEDETDGTVSEDGFGGAAYEPMEGGPENFDSLVEKIRPFNPKDEHGLI